MKERLRILFRPQGTVEVLESTLMITQITVALQVLAIVGFLVNR